LEAPIVILPYVWYEPWVDVIAQYHLVLPEVAHHHIEVLLGDIARLHHLLLGLVTHKEYVQGGRVTGSLRKLPPLFQKLSYDIRLPVGKVDEGPKENAPPLEEVVINWHCHYVIGLARSPNDSLA